MYKKINMGAYNLHLIKSDKFKTIEIKINFKREATKKDITYRNVLKNILLESNEIYKTRRQLDIKTEELYGLRYSINSYLTGIYSVISFNTVFLDEKYTESGMIEESLKFITDIILKPDVSCKKFASEALAIAKNLVKEDIDAIKDDPRVYSTIRLLEEIESKSPLAYRGVGYSEYLEEINEDTLYEYYKSVVNSDLVDVFIIGNIDFKTTEDIFKDNFKIKTLKKIGKEHYITHKKVRLKEKCIKEVTDYKQSKLIMGFKLQNLTDFEKCYVMNVYSFILGGGPDSKLFREVREKNSLCYSISSSQSLVNNLFLIRAGINKDDYKKTVKLIKKELKEMEKGNFTEEDIKASKVTYLNAFKEIDDSQIDILNLYVSHSYLNLDLKEERIKKIMNVKKEDIVKVAKKIYLDTIYLLEGESKDGQA